MSQYHDCYTEALPALESLLASIIGLLGMHLSSIDPGVCNMAPCYSSQSIFDLPAVCCFCQHAGKYPVGSIGVIEGGRK